MRSDARKRTGPHAHTEADTLDDLRALAGQLIADADTTHPDPFLRGCATGTHDTAQAILTTLGDNA